MSLRGSGALDPSFEEFVVESSTALPRTAYLLTGDRGHAEDLLQTTLLRTAWRWSVASQCPEAYARRSVLNARHRGRVIGGRVVQVCLSGVAIVIVAVLAFAMGGEVADQSPAGELELDKVEEQRPGDRDDVMVDSRTYLPTRYNDEYGRFSTSNSSHPPRIIWAC